MKILILNHNNENYGTYFRCYFIGKHLSQIGYEVKMICASGRNFDFLIRRKKINPRFEIITLPRIKYHKYFTGQLILRLLPAVFFVLFSSYDIFYAFTVAQPQIGIPAWIAKRIRRKKLIVDWDDLWGGGFADKHPSPIKEILCFFEKKVPKAADMITVASEYLKKKALSLGLKAELIFKIPNGANQLEIKPLELTLARERLGFSTKSRLIVSLGHTYTESLFLLLRAFERVANDFPEAKLVMVGLSEIPAQAASEFEKIKDKIILAGRKDYKEVPYYMAVADVLVLPMADNNIERARFPMRLGDYLCSGRPIVSNAVGEVKYYLEKYGAGLVSEPSSVFDFAENIKRVLKDKLLSERLSENALGLARGDLEWRRIAGDLDKILKAVAQKEAKPKGVIILSPFFEPNTGGVETHLRNLCCYLLKKGYRIAVVTYQPLTTASKGPVIEKNHNYEVYRIPWIGHNLFHKLEKHPVFQFLYLTPPLLAYTFFFLLKNHKKYDVIHAHGLTAALISNIVCKVFRLRFVVSMHAIYSFRPGWWLSWVCRWILFPAKKIFCLAEASRKDLRVLGLPEEKLDIYVQWADQENFKPRNKQECRNLLGLQDKFTVLFVGRLLEKKGVKVLLEVAENLGDEIFFVFIGDGPMFQVLKESARKLGNVLAAGKKEQEEVAIYYGACDLVVVPSQYEEGFARVVLETLFSGRPIVAARAGCLPEMVTDEIAILLEPTAENLTKQISFFYRYPAELAVLGKNCRNFALKYFSEENAKPIENSYYL